MKCDNEKKTIDLGLAISIIVANMIGIGIYTSLGYQLEDIKSVSAILLLWIIGGIVSLCGALVYAELAMHYPKSGGEYNYISNIFNKMIGFMAGWITIMVAFPAPIASISIAFATYISTFYPNLNITITASLIVLSICFINLKGITCIGIFQKSFVYINAVLIIGFIIFGFIHAEHSHFVISYTKTDLLNILKPSFAVSLVYVAYAYTGWNAITYVAGEVKRPKITIPAALIFSTLIVAVIYVLLNLLFLYAVPAVQLEGKIEIAQIAGQYLFGNTGVKLVSLLIGIGLLASANSMMISGSYVTKQIFCDFSVFKNMQKENKCGAPVYPIIIQTLVALVMIFTASFQKIIIYMGFTLTLINVLAVVGLFVVRKRKAKIDPNFKKKLGYKTLLYPLTPIVFIIFQTWMLVYVFIDSPVQAIIGLGIMLLGALIYKIAIKTN